MSGVRPSRAQQGLTLLELAVAFVPLALIALSLFAAFRFTVTFSRRGEAGAEVAQYARLALHRMAAELREASAAPGGVVIWSRDDGAGLDGVGFLTARVNGAGRPFVTTSTGHPRWQQAVYYLHDPVRRELRRIASDAPALSAPVPGAGTVVARHIARLRLVREGDVVTIALIIARPSGDAALQTAVRPRN